MSGDEHKLMTHSLHNNTDRPPTTQNSPQHHRRILNPVLWK